MSTTKRVAIIGAGLSGLTLGYWLKKKNIEVKIFESSSRVGGSAGSVCEDGFIVERGPNSLLDNEPSFQNLIDDLQLRDKVIYPTAQAKKRYIFLNNKIFKLPMSPVELLKTKLIGSKSKYCILTEGLRSFKVGDSSESIFAFAEKHFGREVAENIFIPATLGVFAGNARDLSLSEALPRLREIEKEHKSLIRGMIKSKSRSKGFSFQNGTQDLVDALSSKLKSEIFLNQKVDSWEFTNNQWSVNGENFDALAFCASPSTVDSAPVVSLSMAFNRKIDLEGFGILIHPHHKMKTLGILCPSHIYSDRAPQNSQLLTLIMGGSFFPQITQMKNEELIETALQELKQIFGQIPTPQKSWVFKYPSGIAQYSTNSKKARQEQEAQLTKRPGLYLNSQAFGGVSVNDCVRKSFDLAQRIAL